jgi:hypothetical protein
MRFAGGSTPLFLQMSRLYPKIFLLTPISACITRALQPAIVPGRVAKVSKITSFMCELTLGWRIKFFFILLIIFPGFFSSSFAQCTIVSSDGYSVTIAVEPVAVIPSSTDCPWGYNYNVTLNYNITFSGSNIPASLYTLQGMVRCNTSSSTTTDLFYDLPNNGGTGSVTTGSNPFVNVTGGIAYNYTGVPNCNSADPGTLGCLSNNLSIQINGPGIADQTVSCTGATLPVKLISFKGTAIQEGVQLDWVTGAEEKFNYFQVERAGEALQFEGVATVEGKGGLKTTASYRHLDKDPLPGKNYYRLRSVDLDGSFEYSNVIIVPWGGNQQGVKLYPNPVEDKAFTLELSQDQTLPAGLVLMDPLGRILFRQVLHTGVTQQIQLPENVEPGMYFVKVSLGSQSKVLSVMVK